jgi:NADH pyrophosphatase NudC (nudix superfamily)
VDPGEAPAETVVREMAEELGIEVRAIRRVWRCPTEDGGYMLEWWLTEIVSGVPRPESDEVAEARWVTPEEIHDLSPTFADDVRFIDEVWPTL